MHVRHSVRIIWQLWCNMFARFRRPARFTIRELMVVVERDIEGKDYLPQVFGWYSDRTSSLRTVLGTIIIALGVVLASRELTPQQAQSAGYALVIVIGCHVLLGRILLSPMHREFLYCLGLLKTLQRLHMQLKAVPHEEWPEPKAFCWAVTKAVQNGGRVAKKIHELRENAGRLGDRPSSDSADWDRRAGKHLLYVLAGVPTDEYERRPVVRHEVDRYLLEILDLAGWPQPAGHPIDHDTPHPD